MNRRCTAVVFASVLALAALVGLAWAANVEEELKKLETDRAAAAAKGDVATLEKQTSDDYEYAGNPSLADVQRTASQRPALF